MTHTALAQMHRRMKGDAEWQSVTSKVAGEVVGRARMLRGSADTCAPCRLASWRAVFRCGLLLVCVRRH